MVTIREQNPPQEADIEITYILAIIGPPSILLQLNLKIARMQI